MIHTLIKVRDLTESLQANLRFSQTKVLPVNLAERNIL